MHIDPFPDAELLTSGGRSMTANRLAAFLVAGLFFLYGGSASAQSCPATNFTGTITAVDGSQPSEPFGLGAGHCCGWWTQTTGPGPELSLSIWEAWGWDIEAWNSDYFQEKRPASVNCVNDPVTSCPVCTPAQMSFDMYAQFGSFHGTAVSLPSGACGGQVVPAPYFPAANVDEHCTYDFTRLQSPLWQSNHWAMFVYRADGTTGPGYGTYTLSYGGTSKDATTSSSHSTPVNFFNWSGEPVECTPQAPEVKTPPDSCSDPVSLTSGNVFFAQTDATVAALGGNLQFTRTYNSVNRGDGLFGVFGRGWQHTYEQALSIPEAGVLKLRGANGRPIYFADLDGDLRYDPTVPYTLESWIQKQPDGSYIRYFRKGGTETYDTSGRLVASADAFGNTTTLGYNGSGQLATITGAGGRALTLTYASGRIATLSGPAGTIATYTYDGSGRLASVQYADAAASGYTFTYDPATGAIATVSDLSGKTLETHTYDGSGRAQTAEVSGGQERFTLTYLPNQTQVTTVDGTTTYDFDTFWGQQLVTKVTGPCDSCAGGAETQQWTYDGRGRVATHTDAEGLVTTYVYDPATGDLLSATETKGASSRTTTYTRDAAGRVLTVTAPDRGVVTYTQSTAGPTSVEDAINRTTSLTYTPKGQLETVTNPRLKTTRRAYDATTGDLTSVTDPLLNATTFGYDLMGRRNRITTPAPFSNSTSYTYDVRGRLTRVDFPDTGFVSYTYDRGGRRATMSEKVTAQLTRVTAYAYDSYGRLHTVTDGNTPAGVTTYDYDAMSRLTTITDARGEPTVFHYDTFGRVDRITYPGSPAPVETFTYYPTGRLKTRTDRKGLTTTYTYDDLGRLAQKSYSDGSPVVTFAYDLADRLIGASNAVDTLTWDPDLAGQVKSEASTANGSLVEYIYDGSGNRTTLKLNGSVVLGYEYDDDDRLTKITRGTANFGFTYDAASRRATLANPNGVTTTYGYDVVSRLLSTATKKGNQSRTTSTYMYDFVGDRLTKGGDFAEAYTYDPLDRLKLVKRGNTTTESYTYDKVGNRMSALNSSPWAYDDRNELLSYPGATFQYALNGNMISKVDSTGSWTYEWSVENQLTRVLKNGAEVARYAYDPIGRRVEKVAGGVTTASLYDGEDILRQTVGTNVTTYLHGPGIDEPLASENAAGVRTYLHADGLDSVVKTTNSSGAAVSTFKYNAFGVLESGAPAPYAYTGREWEPESGLYYYRARYYDPKIGRFLSEDPIGLLGGDTNLYAYVHNGPATFIDPMGRDKIPGGYGIRAAQPNITTTVCDGKGGVAIQLGNMQRSPSKCIIKCALAHEGTHIIDILQTSPTVCVGQLAGAVVSTNTDLGHHTTEWRSYTAEAACLRKCACDPLARERLNDIVDPQVRRNRELMQYYMEHP
jgi:RHS repeat-associated protein